MERIGIAASKIAKGNIVLYNFFVVLLTLLFSAFAFFVCGAFIILILVMMDYVRRHILISGAYEPWIPVFAVIAICLGLVIGVMALSVIIKNIKIRKK